MAARGLVEATHDDALADRLLAAATAIMGMDRLLAVIAFDGGQDRRLPPARHDAFEIFDHGAHCRLLVFEPADFRPVSTPLVG